jgi:ATP-dependent Lon protease
VRRYDFGVAEKENQIGQVVGLAWTEVGGDLLTIEAVSMPGKGNVIRTGTLGDVMKESIEAARTVVRSRARAWASRTKCSRRATSTSTCRKARRRRMVRRPVLR